MIADKWKCSMIRGKIGVDIDKQQLHNGEIMDNPFKPNTSRVDKLENQIINLRERVAKLERDLHFFMRHYEIGID